MIPERAGDEWLTRSTARESWKAVAGSWLGRMSTTLGDPRTPIRALRGLPAYVRNLATFARLQGSTKRSLRLDPRYLYPRPADRHEDAGVASGHYFWQDVWAARCIHDAQPRIHVDIGSRIDGFVAHLLSFREVYVVDIRPLASRDPRLHFVGGDITRLPFADRSVSSLSSLHVIEHVGLGRYGDSVDPQGCFIAMAELVRVLAPGGRLYLSVPIGRERVEFDAHRVLSPDTVLEAFNDLTLVEFSAVDDGGDLVEHTAPERFRAAKYACGLFLFQA